MAVKTNCIKNGVPYYRIHRKINGKYEDFYGKNKSDAEDQYYERKKEAESGIIQTKEITTRTLLHKWLFTVKKHEIKESTLEKYEGNFRNHIEPFAFSDIPIKKISSLVVQDYYNTLFEKKRSTEKITDIHKLLHQFFIYCEKGGYIVKNPCGKGLVKIPKDKDIDVDGIADINIDLDKDGKADINIDTNGDDKPELNIDYRHNLKSTFNIDTDNDGFADFNLVNDATENPKECRINCDTDGDGWPEINIDLDGDGVPDTNIDTDNDGIPDLNLDIDGDGKCDLMCDTDGDNKCDVSCIKPDDGVIDDDGNINPGKPNKDQTGNGDTDASTPTLMLNFVDGGKLIIYIQMINPECLHYIQQKSSM